jgi:enoyl-CoA hydratase/carnithine racemase
MPVALEIAGPAARVTLDNPETRNAISLADMEALTACLDEAEKAPIRALVLTGGGHVFSSGADLSDVIDPGNWTDNPLSALCDRLQAFPMPTVARLNGPVIGGAAELTFACDFRIGVETMKLMVPAARIGIHYEPSGLARAAAVIGWQAARRVYLLAETISGSGLTDSGYLDRIVAAEALDETVEEMLRTIAAAAPLAVNGMKQTMRELQAGLADPETLAARVRAAWSSEDLKEGLAAAKARRAPKFTGR